MITIETARLQCRIDSNFENDLVQIYIDAAREWVENYTGRALTQRAEVMKYDSFCDRYVHHRPALVSKFRPLESVVTILYTDTNGDDETLAPAEYRVVGNAVYARAGKSFPQVQTPSQVIMTANVGEPPEDVPASLKQAVLLLVSHYYNNRDAVEVGTITATLPMGVKALCDPYRPSRV